MRNKRKRGRITSFVMVFAMSLSMLCGVATSSLQVMAAATVSNPRIADDGTVTWDKVEFGSYPQDMIASQIKWRILDVDDSGNAFLLADEALDCKPYNNDGVKKTNSAGGTYTDYTCTWETSTLRDWLNGTDAYATDETAFIKAAFSEEEREAIIVTTVVNDDNTSNNTTDKIYLLSIGEASNIAYGFAETVNEESKTRQAKATDYARLNGVCRSGSGGTCYWWLRSPSDLTGIAAHVYGNGYCDGIVNDVYCDTNAVRPTLHVNLSSPYVKDAGTVTSDGSVTAGTNSIKNSSEYRKPSISSEGVTTWDCVYFGNYKQNATFEEKPIEWRVLSVNGNDAFVVADKALDCKPYNNDGVKNSVGDTYTDYTCTWETSTLRDWLNGTDAYATDETAFIKAAFSEEEREAIIVTTVVNDDNTSYRTKGGNNTTDKIYLLSIGEASNTAYGFAGTFNEESKTRQAKATDYAYMNGAYRSDIFYYGKNLLWWLRSPGDDTRTAANVDLGGIVDESGNPVIYGYIAVRPALHINLSSPYVEAAGTVSSESNITDKDIEAQKKADAVITLISVIGTVTKDSKAAIDSARNAYDALSETGKNKVTNYGVLQEAESKYAELTKSGSSGNDNVGENDDNGSLSNSGNASETTGGITDNTSSGNTGTTPATTETAINTPAMTETPNDNLTTFNIKNKKTYKKSQKVTIKDEDGIKSVVLNTKKIKVKKGKKSVSFKLSSYKKSLKKKNKWNKITVTDVNSNKKTIQFKAK